MKILGKGLVCVFLPRDDSRVESPGLSDYVFPLDEGSLFKLR